MLVLFTVCATLTVAAGPPDRQSYANLYRASLRDLDARLHDLLGTIASTDPSAPPGRERIRQQIHAARTSLKAVDFWFRYFEPVAYMRLNGRGKAR